MNVYCTYYRGQYLASICGHWEREAYPLHRIHQGPIAVCSRTNTAGKITKAAINSHVSTISRYLPTMYIQGISGQVGRN